MVADGTMAKVSCVQVSAAKGPFELVERDIRGLAPDRYE